MTYKLKIYDCLCATETFEINGIEARSSDFGEQGDVSREEAEPYACGNMTFTPDPPTEAVLAKYGISTDEYNQIAAELAEKLSFGTCGWCV